MQIGRHAACPDTYLSNGIQSNAHKPSKCATLIYNASTNIWCITSTPCASLKPQLSLPHRDSLYNPRQSIEHGPIVAAIVGEPAAGGACLSAWCSWWWIQIFLIFLGKQCYIGSTTQTVTLLHKKGQERMGQPVLTPTPQHSPYKGRRHKVMQIAP
jgi:hypothetical protein